MKLRFSLYFLISLCLLHIQLNATNTQDSLRMIIAESRNDVSRFHAMVLLASDMIPGNMDSARIYLKQSRDLKSMLNRPTERAAWLNISGNYNWFSGNIDSAIVNYRITYHIDHADIIDRRAAAAINLASLYDRRGLADSALYYFNSASDLFAITGDNAGSAHAYYSIAISHLRKNNYELALRYGFLSLEIREELADTFNLMHTYNVIGNIYYNLGRFKKSMHYYEKVLQMSVDQPNHPVLMSIYNNLASIHLLHKQNFEEGLKYAEKAIALARQRNGYSVLFAVRYNVALMHYKQSEYDQALKILNDILSYDPNLVLHHQIALGHVTAGDIYTRRGEFEKARAHYYIAFETAANVGALKAQQLSKQGLFALDSTMGNYFQAIGHLQAARVLHDSIWQQERADRLAELEIIYDIDIKNAENLRLQEANALKEKMILNQRRLLIISVFAVIVVAGLLIYLGIVYRKLKIKNLLLEDLHNKVVHKQHQITKQNNLLDAQKKDLEKANKTKDKFFSIISHDLRGPFTSLIGLLGLLLEEFDQMSDEEKKESITGLQQTSVNTFNLLENLLEWSQVQRGLIKNQPSEIIIRNVADKAISMLSFSIKMKQHTVINNAPVLKFSVDFNLLLSVFINLLNNSIKFTPAGGTIRIDGEKSEDVIRITITDNGIGIPKQQQNTLFKLGESYRQAGTDHETGTGLGLVTAKEFITLMGGEISVQSTEGKGSTFSITLPLTS